MSCVNILCRDKAGWKQKWLKDGGRVRLKRDGTCAETRFRISPKRTSPFKSAGASVQLTAGSRGLRSSVSNAEYTTFLGYPLHSPFSPSLPLPCVTVCHQVSNALYKAGLGHATSRGMRNQQCAGKTRLLF